MFLKTLIGLTAAVLLTGSSKATEGWSVMKSGMSPTETATALGDPLFKNISRGFEVWLYDSGAEVLCFQGRVVAWTAPLGVKSPDGRQIDLRPFFLKASAPDQASESGKKIETDLNLAPVRQMRLPKL